MREPQAEGVARVKLLLEAGFHAGRSKDRQATAITESAHSLLDALSANISQTIQEHESELHNLVTDAWRTKLQAPAAK
jgi:hypothetical protein